MRTEDRAPDDGRTSEVPSSSGQSLEDVAIAAALALLATGLSLFVARQFDNAQVYDAMNTLLDADPLTRRYIMAENVRDCVFVKHPNLGHFVNPPIRFAASALGGGDPAGFRWSAALLLVPFAAGIKTAAIFLMLRMLRLDRLASLAVALVSALTFSHLFFGSMPESFGLSGAWLAVLLLAGAWRLRQERSSIRRDLVAAVVLVLIGVFGIGVTVTNLVPFGIVLVCVEWRRVSPLRAMVGASVICTAAIVLNAAVLAVAVGPHFDPQRQRATSLGIRFFHDRPLERAARFPIDVSNEFAPPTPGFVAKPARGGMPYFTMTRPTPSRGRSPLVPVIVWSAMIAGTWGCLRGPPAFRTLAIAALLNLAYNAAFHSVWGGKDLLLYSMHWEAGIILLIAGILLPSSTLRLWLIAALAGCAIYLALHNFDVLSEMIDIWEAEGPGYRLTPVRELVRP